MRTRSVFLALLGVIVGLFAAQGISMARAGTGGWQCYVVDRLKDPKDAAGWKGAAEVTAGLNNVAPTVTSGTILAVQYPVGGGGFAGQQSDVGLVCVKN